MQTRNHLENAMTQLLEQAFREAQKLPDDAQNALAQLILDELQDEERWDEAFARTTDEQWDCIATQVRAEIG